MAAVQSTMQELGSSAPGFDLPDVSAKNQHVSLDSCADKPLLVMFICNHCPYVIHVIEKLVELANKAHADGFSVVAISSNDVENYPQDGPQAMQEFAQQTGFGFPYLYDESQSVAKAYSAACTPDFFVYDKNHRLQYRGQMDASRPGNTVPVSGEELQAAIDAILEGLLPAERQIPSVGCNIKWRAGNEPDYF